MFPKKNPPWIIANLSPDLFPAAREQLCATGDHYYEDHHPNMRNAPASGTVGDSLANADVIIVDAETVVDDAFLDTLPRLKIIARDGARLDNIDLDAATRRGILVLNVPEANLISVVEHTFLMILALARNLKPIQVEDCGDIQPAENTPGFQLAGKVLGILGFGKQGREIAARAQAFGMHVLAYDPYIDLSYARQQHVQIVDFGELLARSDILTLHTAYTQQTHQFIDQDALSQIKPGAILINTIHKHLLDEAALLAALEDGTLGGAALDTHTTQHTSRLQQHPHVILTPNLHHNTLEARTRTANEMVTNLLLALSDRDYRQVVNLPFNLEVPYAAVRPYILLASKLGKLLGQLANGWITRVEVELLGEGLSDLVRPVAAVLLSGMLRSKHGRRVNWVSAPVLAYEQGIATAQVKELVPLADYPNLIACRIYWDGGQLTVAGVLFGNGEARLVQYDDFEVDAYPDGYVLILENDDIPGVIGKVGTRLGQAKINIAQWRYGRDVQGRAVSFINLDHVVPAEILAEIEQEPEIRRASLVRL